MELGFKKDESQELPKLQGSPCSHRVIISNSCFPGKNFTPRGRMRSCLVYQGTFSECPFCNIPLEVLRRISETIYLCKIRHIYRIMYHINSTVMFGATISGGWSENCFRLGTEYIWGKKTWR